MTRAVLLALILASTALAGCLQPSEPTSTSSSSAAPTTSASGSTSTSPSNSTSAAPANQAPNATLSADKANGTAPLNVTFDLDGTDADGDNLTWTLDVDGDGAADEEGSSLPANYTFQYTENGTYNVTLTVMDDSSTATDNLTIVVEEGVAAAPADDDPWATRDAQGMCHADGAVGEGGYYVHDRPADGDPPGSGLAGGGGTWIYEESNDVQGLQIGGAAEDAQYTDCVNPDTLIF